MSAVLSCALGWLGLGFVVVLVQHSEWIYWKNFQTFPTLYSLLVEARRKQGAHVFTLFWVALLLLLVRLPLELALWTYRWLGLLPPRRRRRTPQQSD